MKTISSDIITLFILWGGGGGLGGAGVFTNTQIHTLTLRNSHSSPPVPHNKGSKMFQIAFLVQLKFKFI